jgi:hypothetical protein
LKKSAKITEIGKLRLIGPQAKFTSEMSTFAGDLAACNIVPWKIEGPLDLGFIVHVAQIKGKGYSEWGQVYCDSRLDSSQAWDEIVRRLRVGIRKTDEGYLTMDLRVVLSGIRERASKKILPLRDIDALIGFKIKPFLEKLGALNVGTREALFGEDGKMRNYPCVIFESSNLLVPAAAFVATTICSLLKKQ